MRKGRLSKPLFLTWQQQYANNTAKWNRYNKGNRREVAWMECRQRVYTLNGIDVLLIFFQIAFFAVALYFRSAYLIGCGGLLLWLGGFRLLTKKHTGPWHSVLLIFPAIALCVLSVTPLFIKLIPSYDILQTGVICGLVGAQACFVIVSLIAHRKDKDIPAWMTRQFDAAQLCVLLPALVSQLLLPTPLRRISSLDGFLKFCPLCLRPRSAYTLRRHPFADGCFAIFKTETEF